DEKRARALFAEVMEQITQAAARPERGDSRRRAAYWSATEMRQEVLQRVARRDPQLALDLLRGSRLPPPKAEAEGARPFDADLMLEQRLAARVAANDPARAARMAEESLAKGVTHEVIPAIRQIHARDAAAASALAKKVVERLKTEDFTANPLAPHVADMLLAMHAHPQTIIFDAGDEDGTPPPPASKTRFALDAQTFRDLLDIVVSHSLKAPARGGAPMSLGPLMPEIEKLWPQRAAALRARLAEYERNLDPEARRWAEYGPVLERESPEGLVEAAARAPREMRNTFYARAAFKSLEGGDAERARRILSENVSDSSERAQLLAIVERSALVSLLDAGKFAEARQAVARLRTKEERAVALAHLALIAAAKGERELGAQLLEEARALAGTRVGNAEQLNVHLQLARAYALVEPERGFEIVEGVIDRANEMIGALDTLDGFLGGPELFRDGELLMGRNTGLPSIDAVLHQYGNQLAALARADFDRMRSAAARFHRPEVRIVARLLIAQGLLSDRGWSEPSAVGLMGRGVVPVSSR
ncbi:MAG TPA: hypothetical protein VFX96_09910, partial [Pyrinomonadaceae bacterium]|nr:hypothetical protein [Pyrinomonadaceae bacterium]